MKRVETKEELSQFYAEIYSKDFLTHPSSLREQFAKNGTCELHGYKKWFEELNRLCFRQGDAIIDAGCGPGYTVNFLLTTTEAQVFGVDICKPVLVEAKRNARKIGKADRAEYVVCDAQNLPFRNDQFDGIVCCEVLEHLHNPSKAINEFARIAKAKGVAVLRSPIRNPVKAVFRVFHNRSIPYGFDSQTTQGVTYIFPHRHYTLFEFSNVIKTQGFSVFRMTVLCPLNYFYRFIDTPSTQKLVDAFEDYFGFALRYIPLGGNLCATCTKPSEKKDQKS
jgi:ubiquinone/menaquinone biosynthesis C-methylase UbiE